MLLSQLQTEPLWQLPDHIQQPLVSPHKEWLFDKGSLTQKLIEKSFGQFRVEVLQQCVRAIQFSERKALAIATRRWGVVREVVLYGNNTPWVYARTVIPLPTLQGSLRRFHYLGDQPLGKQLFKDPSMRRESLELARLSPGQLPRRLGVLVPTWGRRSVFRLSNKPLLVSEIFLPELFATAGAPSEKCVGT